MCRVHYLSRPHCHRLSSLMSRRISRKTYFAFSSFEKKSLQCVKYEIFISQRAKLFLPFHCRFFLTFILYYCPLINFKAANYQKLLIFLFSFTLHYSLFILWSFINLSIIYYIILYCIFRRHRESSEFNLFILNDSTQLIIKNYFLLLSRRHRIQFRV